MPWYSHIPFAKVNLKKMNQRRDHQRESIEMQSAILSGSRDARLLFDSSILLNVESEHSTENSKVSPYDNSCGCYIEQNI